MQYFTLATILAAAATLTSAAAVPRQFAAQITFYGAADASYTLSVPSDGAVHTISMSTSYIP
jgi:hypothetical protein